MLGDGAAGGGENIGRCGARGDSGASSATSITGGSPATGGVSLAGFGFERSQSSGPDADSVEAAGKCGSIAWRGAAGAGACDGVRTGAWGIRAVGGTSVSATGSAAAGATACAAAAAGRATGRLLSATEIRLSCRIAAPSPIRTRPPTTATVPEMISVLPRLNALIGMPNPMVTKPAAVISRPTANRTRCITTSLPYFDAGGRTKAHYKMAALRMLAKVYPLYGHQIYD